MILRWLRRLFRRTDVSASWLNAQKYDRGGVDLPYWPLRKGR